ncbi:hypothetical protein NQ314_008861 [Rhamnusium bicolor]|uniref:Glucosidase II subunit alpha n=1 Tax=Rhamnusium bicolor TaxID=1586634 RepID=A0AAV8Y6N8_9CUCU|nr:hypothetical protein NQ314_008861 [Rhamnusium bicolor]
MALGDTTDGSSDPFRLRNSDVYEYEVDSPMALYGSIPVIYGHTSFSTSGVFFHNAAEEWIDISYKNRPSANFFAESGVLDLFVLLGPSPKNVVQQYTSLTGTAPLPQLWTLGYHQCRFTYESQEDVKTVVATMIEKDFPMDVLWLDDGHSNGNRYFEWNPENFTDPIEMQQNVSAAGKKLVSISDPHIKIANDYAVYNEAEGKYFVKWANGSDFQGECWPGMSSYMDFLNPEASDYYSSLYGYDKFNKTTETLAGIWNDMNEPSVFDDSLEKTLPFETLHYGGVPHRDIHNIYGFLHTRATHKGLLQRDKNTKRPFILTRSFFAGSQRYAAIWTGDNAADWSYLSTSYSQCLTANILGIVYCGADVGGFETEPDHELLQRWYQAGVWLPFYRGHSGKETPRREPYLFPENVQSVIRNALKVRYKHIPVFYTLAFRHSESGDPIIRPLFYEYNDLLDYDEHVLVGSDILARPVMVAGATSVNVTFPGSHYWYRVDDNSFQIHHGGNTHDIPVSITTSPFFYRGGSIITRKDREKLATSHMVDDPYMLYVNLDENNTAKGLLYVDDYTSFDYLNNYSFLYITFEYLPYSHGLRIRQVDGNSTGIDISLQEIIIHGNPTNPHEAKLARNALLFIISSLKYLLRQGIAIPGHSDEKSNIRQLLLLRAEDNSDIKSWLNRTNYSGFRMIF